MGTCLEVVAVPEAHRTVLDAADIQAEQLRKAVAHRAAEHSSHS